MFDENKAVAAAIQEEGANRRKAGDRSAFSFFRAAKVIREAHKNVMEMSYTELMNLKYVGESIADFVRDHCIENGAQVLATATKARVEEKISETHTTADDVWAICFAGGK